MKNKQRHLLIQSYNSCSSIIYNQKNKGIYWTLINNNLETSRTEINSLEVFSSFPCPLNYPFYSMEYARTTSTIGARHKGHLPPLRTNSLAHFEHVHMCPHLQKLQFGERTKQIKKQNHFKKATNINLDPVKKNIRLNLVH